MDRTFIIVILVVVIFTGFLIGYSVPPFIEAGVLSGRKEKGVENKIDKSLEQHYKDLYKTDGK
jgi:NhaP-type Na+/H+ or K+/H+ antiporter